MINESNYEVYIIDYLEGNLDAVQVSELLLFIEQNPDVKSEFEELSSGCILIQREEGIQLEKSSLKKPVYHQLKEKYDRLLVAAAEGDLNAEQLDELSRLFVLYPELVSEKRLFGQAKMLPDFAIIYNEKRLLKRSRIVSIVPMLVRVAAVFIVAGLVSLLTFKIQVSEPVLAEEKGNIPLAEQPSAIHQLIHEGNKTDQPVVLQTKSMGKKIQKPGNIKPIKRKVKYNRVYTLRAKPETVELTFAMLPLQKQTIELCYPQIVNTENRVIGMPELIYAGASAQRDEILTDKTQRDKKEIHKADAGWAALSLLNKLTGADIKVKKKYNKDGSNAGIEIASEHFEFSTSR